MEHYPENRLKNKNEFVFVQDEAMNLFPLPLY